MAAFPFTLAVAYRVVRGIDLCLGLGLCLLAGLSGGHGLVLHIRIAPVAMLAPPQARRLEPGGAATKDEAVDTHSNAHFGGEVEWSVSGTTTFPGRLRPSATAPAGGLPSPLNRSQ